MALTAREIQEAYVTFFSRAADTEGFAYWTSYAGSISDLYATFAQQDEYTSVYGGKTAVQQITTVYQNLFNRAPDLEGVAYWAPLIDAGTITLADLALTVARGAQGTDITALTNKTTVATYYTENAPEYDATSAAAAVADVDATEASVTAAQAGVDALHEQAPVYSGPTSVTVEEDSVNALPEGAWTDVNNNIVSVVASSENGTVDLDANTYTPNANFNGTDTITSTATDAAGNVTTAEVTVTVTAVNDAPTLTATATESVNEDSSVVIAAPTVTDVDDDTVTLTATATNGTVVLAEDGSATYTPTADFNGTATVTFTATDASGATASAATTVTVNPLGESYELTPTDDDFTLTAQDDTVTGTSDTLSANDSVSDNSTTDNDVMNLTLDSDPGAIEVDNVETINIDWQSYSTLDLDLDNVTNAHVVATSSLDGYAGNLDSVNHGANDLTAGSGFVGVIDVRAIEDASITANEARSVIVGTTNAADGAVTVNAAAARTVTVNGGDVVTITAPAATTVTITSTGMDAATLNLGANSTLSMDGTGAAVALNSDTDIEVSLAAGVAFDGLTLGGAGAITLDVADTSDITGDEITGAARIQLSDDAGGAFDAEDFSGVIQYESAQTTGTHVFADGAQVEHDVDAGAALIYATSSGNDEDQDEITVTINASQTSMAFDTANQDFEIVNLVGDAEAALTVTAMDVGTGVLNVSSNIGLTIATLDANEVNASSMTAAFAITTQTTAADMSVVGGSGNNTVGFIGTTHDSSFVGGAGNDTLTYLTTTGDATAIVGAGTNSVTADALNSGNLTVQSGSGTDTISVDGFTSGSVLITDAGGTNTIGIGVAADANAGTIDITTGSGTDGITILGTNDTITVNAGDGTNTLLVDELTTGTLTATGGSGTDVYSVDAFTSGTVTITDAGGTTTIGIGVAADANAGTINVTTGSGTDGITILGTNDTITVNAGDGTNTLLVDELTTGTLTATGGSGTDVYSVDAFTSGTVTITDAGGTTTIGIGVAADANAGTINVTTGSGTDGITILGTNDEITINAGDGANTITAAELTSGSLTYTGGAGNDIVATAAVVTGDITLTLGDGDNRYTANALTTSDVTITAGSGDDTISMTAANTGAKSISVGDGDVNTVTVNTTTGNTTVTGGSGVDTITVTGITTATVVVSAGSGNDDLELSTLALASGANVTVNGGDGADTISVLGNSAAGVTLAINGGDGTDTLDLDVAGALSLAAGTVTMDSIEIIDLQDNAAAGVTVNADLLNGVTVLVNANGSTADGEELIVDIDSAGTYDFSNVSISAVAGAALKGLQITESNNSDITVIASAGDDDIVMGTGDDTITGGAGIDIITTDTGDDTVILGSSADTKGSAYAAANTGVLAATAGSVITFDAITDFTAGTDTIQLSSVRNAYGTGIQLDGDTVVDVVQVALTAAGASATLATIFAEFETAASGVASTSDALKVYVVTLTGSGVANEFDDGDNGVYLIINDHTAALGISDTIIDITGVTGTIAASDFSIV